MFQVEWFALYLHNQISSQNLTNSCGGKYNDEMEYINR